MRAVTAPEPGDADALKVSEHPDPDAGPGEVLIEVVAAGLNRADVLQRQGKYTPPPGSSDVLGMEVSGRIAALGEGVTGVEVGQPVCALLAAGGYAELVAAPVGQVMPAPEDVDLVTAAALPEVAATVWSNVFMVAGLQHGETLLVHGGAGGIGTMAIQLGAARGAEVYATAGSEAKLDVCRRLGATRAISYRDEDFVEVLKGAGGADVILDNMGAAYLGRNIDALADEGRLVIIGMQGGVRGELDINRLLRKRGAVIATALRSRPGDQKTAICAAVVEHVWPLVAEGKVRPIVHATYPLDDVADAHRAFDAGDHVGKILLTTGR